MTKKQDMSRAKAAAVYREGGVERHAEGDFVLCTIPYSVLSRVEVQPEFSAVKWRAIRELNYDSSTKMLAVAAKRFWETDDGIYGGGTFTDLPTVSTYYPSDNADAKNPMASRGPGVMLASYSWGQPARRLASMPHRERAAEVLRHLARIHPQLKTPGIVRHTASWSWDIILGRAVRSRCSCRASTANCRRPPSRPRVASISLASTLRSCIRGCRARSNRDCERRAKCSNRRNAPSASAADGTIAAHASRAAHRTRSREELAGAAALPLGAWPTPVRGAAVPKVVIVVRASPG